MNEYRNALADLHDALDGIGLTWIDEDAQLAHLIHAVLVAYDNL